MRARRKAPTAEQKAAAKAKRAKLIQLSKAAKMAMQTGATEAETVNQALIELYNGDSRHTWKTFKGWKEAGKIVQKGEKAQLIWGAKRKAAVTEEESEETKEYKFFPTCAIFNEEQVK